VSYKEELHNGTEMYETSHLPDGKTGGLAPRTSWICIETVLRDVCCTSGMDKVVSPRSSLTLMSN